MTLAQPCRLTFSVTSGKVFMRSARAVAALAQCIVVCVLKEAAAPESEEFEVSAKSTVHRRPVSLYLYLRCNLCRRTVR